MAALLRFWGLKRVCGLAGDDPYSAGGMSAFVAAAKVEGLYVQLKSTFTTGTNDVKKNIKDLVDNNCMIVVFFGQAQDMKNVFDEADRVGFTAAQRGVQWVLSELFAGSMKDACTNLVLCERVLRGGIVLTPGELLFVLLEYSTVS